MDAGTEPVTLVFIIILVFYLFFFLNFEVAGLVDPARDGVKGRMAGHGCRRTCFYDHDGLCSILSIYSYY